MGSEIRSRNYLPTWNLVRGENFLSYIGIHPKALEAFDYYTAFHSGQIQEIPNQHKNDANQLQQKPNFIKHIKGLIDDYTSAREYFISQLASKLISSSSESKINKVIFRTTDFKSNEMVHLIGSELYEVKEFSPQMGNRGLGRYLQPAYRDLFNWELEACRRAILDQQIELAIIFPFVRVPSQLEKGLAIVSEMDVKPKSIGMMIEVPSNVLEIRILINILTRHTNAYHITPMFLFGLADLTQGILAASRLSSEFVKSRIYYESATEVIVFVDYVLDNLLEAEVPCGIHTEMLESIFHQNIKFAKLLAEHVSFLVEDYWLINNQ